MELACFVCDELLFNQILEANPSMSSDGNTVDISIVKEECSRCGTVRSSDTSFLEDLFVVLILVLYKHY